MRSRETTLNRLALERAVREEQRRLRAEHLAKIRSQISQIHARRNDLIRRVRQQCKRARERTRQQIRERRFQALVALQHELEEMRQAARNRCRLRLARVRKRTDSAREHARAERAERLRAERAIARAERLHAAKRTRFERAEARRRSESDDEVRGNLEAELVPVFDHVRSRIKASPGMSRTERFLHWVEENPSEVWALREELAEKRLRALLREEALHAKHLRKIGGRAARRKAVAGDEPVPF